MKKFAFIKIALVASIVSIILWSCDPTDPNNPNEGEVITSLRITAISGSDTVSFAYSDPDGNGGNPPAIDTAVLATSTVYNVTLELIDETKNPDDTLTSQILAEGIDHQFFFSMTLSLNLMSAYADLDANNNPIGLSNTWTTTTASTGSVIITLKHQPGIKPASPGDILVGETDIEVTFPVRIE